MTSFAQLETLVEEAATFGAIHLHFDIKPEFADTPRDWDMRLEVAFLSAKAGIDGGQDAT